MNPNKNSISTLNRALECYQNLNLMQLDKQGCVQEALIAAISCLKNPQTVFVVSIQSADGDNIRCICYTKETALKEALTARDEIVEEIKTWIERIRGNIDSIPLLYNIYTEDVQKKRIERYQEMIQQLSDNDPDKWGNLPQKQPVIREYTIKE